MSSSPEIQAVDSASTGTPYFSSSLLLHLLGLFALGVHAVEQHYKGLVDLLQFPDHPLLRLLGIPPGEYR